MLIVAAKIVAKAGERETIVSKTKTLVAETRKEKGNISYTLYASTENQTDLLFFEQWSDQAALDAHCKTPHFLAFADMVKDFAAKAPEIKLFTVTE